MTALEGIFEMIKPFFAGIIKYWWIIAIVLVATVVYEKVIKNRMN